MRRYGRDFELNRRGPERMQSRRYDIDRGYRRGGFMGSRGPGQGGPGHEGIGAGSAGGYASGNMGMTAAGSYGAGGPYTAYGNSRMGITFGNETRRGSLGGANLSGGGANRGGRGAYLSGPSARRGVRGNRGMRYDVGYGMGNSREWF